MKLRLFAVLAFSVLLLTSCSNNNFKSPENPVISYPTKTTMENADGYIERPNLNSNEKIFYYGNKKSKKFHLSDCVYIEKTTEGNIRLEEDKSVLISDGYTPCSKCKP